MSCHKLTTEVEILALKKKKKQWKNKAEVPILWPPDGKSQIIGKDPAAGQDWEQEEKRVTGDEMVG